MDIKRFDEIFSVSEQVTADDLPALQAQGITALICNRTDGEASGQPVCKDLATMAAASGITMHYLPVVLDNINSLDVRNFAELLQQDGKIHAFCRSGARS